MCSSPIKTIGSVYCRFLNPYQPSANPPTKKRKPRLHAQPVNDCLIVSLIRLLAKLSVITEKDITGEETHVLLLEGKGLIATVGVFSNIVRKIKHQQIKTQQLSKGHSGDGRLTQRNLSETEISYESGTESV